MTILDDILDTKRGEVARAKARRPLDGLRAEAAATSTPRDFFSVVTAPSPYGPHLVTEIKQRSPSAGMIRPEFDPVSIARIYHACGAAAISVLTDETYFGGKLEYVELVKEAVPLPVLRKEFIIDEYQLYESRAGGADAILLIAEAIGVDAVAAFAPLARRLSMTCLVEVHDEANLVAVLDALGPPSADSYLLGINNRDLTAQRTDITTTARLAKRIPSGIPFVSESGLSTRGDVEAVHAAGACAILIGESLLRAPDIAERVNELLGLP